MALDYNIYSLGYNKTIVRVDPFYSENLETKNAFTDGVSLNLLGATEGGQYLSDLGEVAWWNAADIPAIEDIINDRIDTAEAFIKADWTFTEAGAFIMRDPTNPDNNYVQMSPTGLLGKYLGVTTFTVPTTGGPTFRGEVTAESGFIGGWQISPTAIYYDGATDNISAGMASADYPFYAGKKYVDRATAPFRVTPAGMLHATGVDISGKLVAGTGSSIGGAYISNINADTITAGTLTGRTIQTAATDNWRLEMRRTGSVFHPNALSFIDASNNERGYITMEGHAMFIRINDAAASELYLANDFKIANSRIECHALPYSNNTFNLGSSTYQWRYVYATRYYIGSTRKDDVWDSAYSHSTTTGTPHVSSTEKNTWNAKPSLGETSTTAYRGDYGKAAYDLRHARSHNHSNSSDGTALQPASLLTSGTIETSGNLNGGYLTTLYRSVFGDRIRLWNNNGYPTTNNAIGQMYYHSTEKDVRVRRDTSWADLCWYDERNAASPLPTAENAIEKLKEIKGPTVSKDGLAFDTEDFPKEFHIITANKTLHTNLLPVIGMLIKSQKELLAKVEELQNKLK